MKILPNPTKILPVMNLYTEDESSDASYTENNSDSESSDDSYSDDEEAGNY